jgi:dolichol-phosphate mannosyltransferase
VHRSTRELEAAIRRYIFIIVLAWKYLGLLPSGAGLATIALSVFLIGGVQLFTLGILGEYVGRIFDEVKRRPVAVAVEILGNDTEP